MPLEHSPSRAAVTGTSVFAVNFHRERKTTTPFDLADLERELQDPQVFSWIDIQSGDIGHLNDVLRRLGLDLVLTSHFDEPEILPRIVERPDCLAFYLYEVEDPELHLDTSQGMREIDVVRMVLVLGDDFVLTFHRYDVDAVAEIRARCAEAFRLWGRTQGFIAFLFLQRCLYDYSHLNLANDNFLDRLEDAIKARDPQVPESIRIAGANILTLKKLASSLHIVLMLLSTKRSVFVSEESRPFYREMMENAVAVRAAIDSSRDLLSGLVGAIQAEAANRTGDIARVLTVVSAVILPLTLIAGIYGMNFQNMPELRTTHGYFVVLGVMVLTAGVLMAAFWKMGWLSTGGGGRGRRR